MFVAKRLRDNHDFDSLRGWWVNVGYRLLLIKNQYYRYYFDIASGNDEAINSVRKQWLKEKDLSEEFLIYKKSGDWFVLAENITGVINDYKITRLIDKIGMPKSLPPNKIKERFGKELLKEITDLLGYPHLYVSDHGRIGNIYQSITSLLDNFTWSNRAYLFLTKSVYENEKKGGMGSMEIMTNPILPQIVKVGGPLFPLRDLSNLIHFSGSDEELKTMIENADTVLGDDFRKQLQEHSETLKEDEKYAVEYLIKKHDEIVQHTPCFFDSIYNDEHLTLIDKDKLIGRILLEHVLKDVIKGVPALYRPILSYGDRYNGAPYSEFEKPIETYFKKAARLSQIELAKEMRKILVDKYTDTSDLNFLPCLTVAWFISEAARNPLTTMTSLMLVDMIENEPYSYLETGSNSSWYSWSNTLIHFQAKTDAKDPVADVYGNSIKTGEFGGSHPMVHGGSAAQGDYKSALKSKPNLEVAQQKEGNLLIHWLKLMFDFSPELRGKLNIKEARAVQFDGSFPPDDKERNTTKESIVNEGIIPLLMSRIGTTEDLLAEANKRSLEAITQARFINADDGLNTIEHVRPRWVPGDGDCAFHALNITRDEFLNAVKEIYENEGHQLHRLFHQLFIRVGITDFNAWYDELNGNVEGKDRAWAGEFEICLIAYIRNISIRIFRLGNNIYEQHEGTRAYGPRGAQREVWVARVNMMPVREANAREANHYIELERPRRALLTYIQHPALHLFPLGFRPVDILRDIEARHLSAQRNDNPYSRRLYDIRFGLAPFKHL
jgi:hypothetical protein